MNPAVLLVALVALPPLLMAAAHVYAVQSQDRSAFYIVLLDPRVRSSHQVAAEHARRHRIRIESVWNASVKGYTAVMSRRGVAAVTADRRVISVELRDLAESSVLDT